MAFKTRSVRQVKPPNFRGNANEVRKEDLKKWLRDNKQLPAKDIADQVSASPLKAASLKVVQNPHKEPAGLRIGVRSSESQERQVYVAKKAILFSEPVNCPPELKKLIH